MQRLPGDPRVVHPLAHGGAADTEDMARRSQRIAILSTEHWNLLATRSLSWSESFSRATMFLTVLSGAVVALALVAQATNFGDGFTLCSACRSSSSSGPPPSCGWWRSTTRTSTGYTA